MRVRWRKPCLAAAGSLLLGACFVSSGCSGAPEGEATSEAVLAEIRTAPIVKETIVPRARGVGMLEPFPGLSAEILPSLPGHVAEIRVREGDRVEKGQLLARMDTSSRARSEHTQAKLALAAAELQAGRAKRLFEAGVWPKATWEEAERNLQGTRSQEEATAADARREGSSAELRSPLSGVVSNLTATVGALADGSAPLMRVVDSSVLLARLQVPFEEAREVSVGAKVSLSVPALPGSAAQETVVWRKALPLDAGNQNAQIQLRMDNSKGLLAPGMAVEASIALVPREGLVVPAEAVVTLNAATVLFRIAGGRAAQVAVRAIELDKGRSEVVGEGLKAGDRIATTGAYELSDGMAVKVAP